MTDPHGPGLLLIALGVGLTLLGLLVWSGMLGFFGNLPGDFHFEGKHTQIYVPFTSCVLGSIVLSLLMILARKFL